MHCEGLKINLGYNAVTIRECFFLSVKHSNFCCFRDITYVALILF